MSLPTKLSNISYTNKDFNSIYAELLEYAKKLSYKWDPTCSDESDPGVVLLKLAAIIGDKDSYNIDKNILELMPASVTQLPAARQLFEQCGYSMRYYRAAEGDINITIKEDLGDDLEDEEITYNYTIPQFTMFSDTDNSVVYTTVKSETIPKKTDVAIPVIEGTVVSYAINNDTLVTTQNLDSKNRLYFTESNIAENGIFITTVDSTRPSFQNYEDWKRVDNLEIQPSGTYCYKFGVTIDGAVCYIEFPQDIELLIGEGLNIQYILTSGSAGNISAGTLRQFYSDTKFSRTRVNGTTATQVEATQEKVSIKNVLPIFNGQDPESIEDAYRNYKRVRDTFNTLVSLKDYSDYLVTSESASNGYVCDRTNDIQHAYKILTTNTDSTCLKTVFEKQTDTHYMLNEDNNYVALPPEPVMNAFQLCAYALTYVYPVNDSVAFKSSFYIQDASSASRVFANSEENSIKSLQHDYIDFDVNRILMLKNKYPVTANIVPRYTLSQAEKLQVLLNIEKAMCNALNANKVTFGEDVSTETIKQAILNADERIKALIDFTTPKYQTFAVYKNESGDFSEIRIDNDSDDGGFIVANITTSNSFEAEKKNLYVKNDANVFTSAENESFDSAEVYYTYDKNLGDLWNNFRVEIFAKNVLSGVTPLYTADNTFTSNIAQTDVKQYSDIVKISTNVEIALNSVGDSNRYESRILQENENILLTCPNLIEENNFSSYVKMLYFLPSYKDTKFESNSCIELKDENDFVIFFYKQANTDDYYTYVKYDGTNHSKAKFIVPNEFSLSAVQNLGSTSYNNDRFHTDIIRNYFLAVPTGKGYTRDLGSSTESFIDGEEITHVYDFVSKCLNNGSNNQILTGTKIMYTKNIHTVHVNNVTNGSSSFYWILNHTNKDKQYELFEPEKDSYILQSGEYFMYANDNRTTLYLLGEGTRVTKEGWAADTKWTVDPIAYDDILTNGIDYVPWKTLPKSDTNKLIITEQQRLLIGPGNKLIAQLKSDTKASEPITLNSSTEVNFKDYVLRYEDASENMVDVPSTYSESVAWTASTILNINMSSTHPQELDETQSFTLYDDSDESKGTEITSCYVQCDSSLNIVGGQNIDIRGITSRNFVKILTYKDSGILDESNSNVGHDHSTGETVIELTDGENDTEKTLTVNLKTILPGRYLLQLIPSSDADIDVTSLSEGSLSEVSSTTYQLIVGSDPDADYGFTLSWTSAERGTTLRIPPLFKYTDKLLRKIKVSKGTDSGEKSFEQHLLDKITSLEQESDSSFNYIYQPVSPINNPLISEEFMKKDHFYNRYTICEWDTDIENRVTIHDVSR